MGKAAGSWHHLKSVVPYITMRAKILQYSFIHLVFNFVKCLVTSGYPDGSSSGGPGSNPGEDENF